MSETNSKKRTVGDAAANLGLSMAYMFGVTVSAVMLGLHLYFEGPVLGTVAFLVIFSLLVSAGIVVAVAMIRSIIRLALEMRKEYCFDCSCSCKHETATDESGDSAGEFQKDPHNPNVMMYPAMP